MSSSQNPKNADPCVYAIGEAVVTTKVAKLSDNYPLFTKGRWMRTGKDRVEVGAVNDPIAVGDVRVNPRDIVIADANGVVIVPRHRAREVADIASRIEESEAGIRRLILSGATIAEAREKLGYHTLQRKK
jgi:regulator of RNase E activity RraA